MNYGFVIMEGLKIRLVSTDVKKDIHGVIGMIPATTPIANASACRDQYISSRKLSLVE